MHGGTLIRIVALSLMSGAVAAQTISGSGAKHCADYMQAVELNSAVARNGFISWAQGYISGFNATNVKRSDVAIDPAGLQYWLSNFCSANPEVSYYEAVLQLISQNAK